MTEPKRWVTHSERVRDRLRTAMDVCPTCKRASSDLSLRDVAAATGVSFSTVGRFLRGRAVNSFALDAIEAFLDLDEPDHG